MAQLVLLALGQSLELSSLTKNSSFEEDNVEASWTIHTETTGTIQRVEGTSFTGDSSLLASAVENGYVSQRFSVKPGVVAAQVRYYAPADAEEGTIRLELHGIDKEGERVITYEAKPTPIACRAGEWATLDIIEAFISTAKTDDATADVVQAEVVVSLEETGSTDIYIDDIVVFQDFS